MLLFALVPTQLKQTCSRLATKTVKKRVNLVQS